MSDEWYSPSLIFDALGIEFDLDPCHPSYPTNVPCKKYFTIEDDGLKQSWGGGCLDESSLFRTKTVC